MSDTSRIRPQSLSPLNGPDDGGHRDRQEVDAAGDDLRADDDGEEGAEIDMGEEDQALAPRVARSPREPTSAERQLHEVTHLPLRSWCRHCMMGRCKDVCHAPTCGGTGHPTRRDWTTCA